MPIKAYRNLEFLTGPDARPLRILAEYMEPLSRLQRHGVARAIIFYGSARTRPQHPQRGPDCAHAAELAERLARWTMETHQPPDRFFICTGGGPGIMEAAHEGAARVDRHLNIGLNISLPFEQHLNPYVAEELAFEFHYFFMRKLWFANLAHGLAVFPGGFGTLDELFEMLTLMQTGKLPRLPTVLFAGEFWRRVVNFDLLVEQGLISPEDLELFRITDSVDEAFAFLTERVEQVERDR